MEDDGVNFSNFSTSFFDKNMQEDENIQARIKFILNQILENRGNSIIKIIDSRFMYSVINGSKLE